MLMLSFCSTSQLSSDKTRYAESLDRKLLVIAEMVFFMDQTHYVITDVNMNLLHELSYV